MGNGHVETYRSYCALNKISWGDISNNLPRLPTIIINLKTYNQKAVTGSGSPVLTKTNVYTRYDGNTLAAFHSMLVLLCLLKTLHVHIFYNTVHIVSLKL